MEWDLDPQKTRLWSAHSHEEMEDKQQLQRSPEHWTYIMWYHSNFIDHVNVFIDWRISKWFWLQWSVWRWTGIPTYYSLWLLLSPCYLEVIKKLSMLSKLSYCLNIIISDILLNLTQVYWQTDIWTDGCHYGTIDQLSNNLSVQAFRTLKKLGEVYEGPGANETVFMWDLHMQHCHWSVFKARSLKQPISIHILVI